jgi:beta-glucanase (GH16 family)
MMQFRIFTLFFSIGLTFVYSCTDPDLELGCNLNKLLDDYELVWSDEFDGNQVDETKWTFDLGDGCDISENLCGWGNNELQYYTDRAENVTVSDGILTIQARKENPKYLGEFDYTSARMVTKNKGDWKYCRVDVRARLPIGVGLWAAAWMLPTDTIYGDWPKSGEIDIMEYIGSNGDQSFSTIHFGHNYHQFYSQEYDLPEGNFYNQYHVFTTIWNENCILFQVDGNDVGEAVSKYTTLPTTYPFDQPFHLILNMAVGGNLPGAPDPSTIFPQRMRVDYVRVYQEK